jgi:extracellular factor (EF) 3-hydroxypalmitic acid methyl ester biosynthesis protein
MAQVAINHHPALLAAVPPAQGTERNGDALQRILAISRTVAFRKGEIVMTENVQPDSVCYVERGAMEVSYSMQGTNILVAIIGEGELFGEIGFFDGVSRVRDIRAADDALVRMWDRDQLDEMHSKDPELYGTFITMMAHSICAKFRRIVEEREPLTAYAAAISTGKRDFHESRPLPEHIYATSQWRFVRKSVEAFKADFFDLSFSLQQDDGRESDDRWRDRCHKTLNRFNLQLQECHERIDDPQIEDYFWGYVFKEIFPYFMRSRFAERAYYKPKGYAGDYLMMEMIYRNQPDGDGKLGRLVDDWCLNTEAAQAVRGRRELLGTFLGTWKRKIHTHETFRILNLACGSSRELFDFLTGPGETKGIEVLCVDADPEALQYVERNVNVVPHQASVRLMQENVIKWALGREHHHFGLMDIVYSAGLTDYLDERLFQALTTRCYEHLRPGGVFIIGNFGTHNPNKAFMDHLLQWNLIHRSERELRNIFAATPFGDDIDVVAEPHGVNLVAIAVKRSKVT